MIRNCLICDTEFIPNKYNKQQRFCSKSCLTLGNKNGVAGKIHSMCIGCGNGINRKNAKFCSKVCYTNHQLSKNNILNKEVDIVCQHCNNTFSVKNYKKNSTKFCSVRCSKLGQIRTNKGLDTRITLSCKYCGSDYKIHPYRRENSLYCSSKCKFNAGRHVKQCKFCKGDFTTTIHQNRTFCSLNCSQKYYGPSKLEEAIYDILVDNFGLKNIQIQHTIYGDSFWYCVDFLIYDMVVVEVFGDYWHCNPRLFDDDYYHKQCKKTAKEIRENDLIKIDNLRNSNYIVYSIWEDYDKPTTFNNNLNKIIDEIYDYKTNNSN